MKLKNKLLIIILFFSAFLIFNNKVRAGYIYDNPSSVISSTNELTYDFAKDLCESSDKSHFPDDYSENNYPYFFIRESNENEYVIYYSSVPIRVVATHYYGSSSYYTGIIIHPINNSAKCFSVAYDKNSKFNYYPVSFVDGYSGNSTVAYYSNHNINFCDPPADVGYGVDSNYSYSNISYDNVNSFFLAKCQISPFLTALKVVQSQLYPTQILGTVKILIPVGLLVFSALLMIYILRSKIWRPI